MTTTRFIRKRTKAGLAVFIDLLGFAQRVKGVQTFEDLLKVQEQVKIAHHYFDITKNDKLTKAYLQATGQLGFALSDSIFTFIPLQSDVMRYSDEFGGVMSTLETVALSQAGCVLNGVFVRGGVSLGWFYSDGKNFVSDALIEAISLEKDVCFPVIAVGESVLERYNKSPERKYYSDGLDPFKNGFFLTVTVSGNTISYINYLGMAVEAVSPRFTHEERRKLRKMSSGEAQEFENQRYWETQAGYLLHHKKAIVAAAQAASGNRRALRKYRWLTGYHNSIAEPFQKINTDVMISGKLAHSSRSLF